ncbi:MAG: UvrD-helicase domain-containing protein [Pirellulaceae bacterium]|nr:UvrD-helicase domain-containing protein [Pirellulaceae bacterium]
MPSSENKVIFACAGSGKTTRLVTEAIASRDRRIAIVTYTNNNTREIANRFGELNSGIPKHVEVMTWFGFLLRECARPYQRAKYTAKRVESLLFVNQQSARYVAETDTARHYFANGELIYSDKIAKFVCECENKSSQSVTARLGQIYTDVYIDEFQDLAGWDLEVIELLLQSGIRVTLVGDPRQHIYSTNPSQKNKQYLGIKAVNLVQKWRQRGLCTIESMSGTYRCNQTICNFANALWPGMDIMTPLRNDTTDHDGVFVVAENVAEEYIQRFSPQVLRHDKRAKSYGCEALNFGLAKGLQFERVLIVPTAPIKKYLNSGALDHVEQSRDKLHVAVTRAQHSVAFVYDSSSQIVPTRWTGYP